MDAVREKLKQLEQEYNENNEKLMSPDIVSDAALLTKLSKAQAHLEGPVDA